MSGVYLEPADAGGVPFQRLAEGLLGPLGPVTAARFCDSDGEYQRRYDVYLLTAGDGRRFALKKSTRLEAAVQERFLKGSGLGAPAYFGAAEHEGRLWIITEYIAGPDLRRFTPQMASACAETLSRIQNAWWGRGDVDGRFARYWERVSRRAGCLKDEPELEAAYRLILQRQREMPLTLSSGDFLQLNGVLREGRVYIIDWGFGGMMPYALDIARLIAHGVEKPRPGAFPFYMTDELRGLFVRAMYDRLAQKPDWGRYIADIRLAVLNEYVEFLEELLADPAAGREELENDLYYRRARKAAQEVLRYANE